MRLAPLLAPIMHRVNVFVHHFFVPMRLLWEDWEPFITGGRLGTETPPVPPNVSIQAVLTLGSDYLNQSRLADYLGVGSMVDADAALWTTSTIDLLPFAAYQKIYEDYYVDRNYVDYETDPILPLRSGTMNPLTDVAKIHTLMQRKLRNWQKEYFTSALPWTQRGDEVLMPMVGSGIVSYLDTSEVLTSAGADAGANSFVGTMAAGDLGVNKDPLNPVLGTVGRIENIDSVDFSNTSITINDLRTAARLQEWLERNALAGSRYTESIMAHFARKTSDARLQRAEYLGGGKVTVKISEVLTTAFSEDGAANTVPPASMTGRGFVLDQASNITYNCEEHGFILSILSVMPTAAYMQGSARMFFNRNTFLDYPWPSMAHLGEQPVYQYELFTQPSLTPPDRSDQPVFGYQSRYSDWKYIPSSSHGDFKGSLDFWHLTRKFATAPTLGGTFVTFDDTLNDRVFAVEDVDTLWCYIYNKCTVKRSLPYFGTPML